MLPGRYVCAMVFENLESTFGMVVLHGNIKTVRAVFLLLFSCVS